MSMVFDEIFNMSPDRGLKPLCSIDMENEEELLKWLNTSVATIKDDNAARHEIIRSNVLRYKGFYDYADKWAPNRNGTYINPRIPFREVYNNVTQDLVDTRITQNLYNKPNTEVIPASMEFRDQQASRTGKLVLESLKYENQIENIYRKQLLNCFTAGESFLFILWDENRGPVHPSYGKVKDKKIPLLDSNGKKLKTPDGSDIMVKAPRKVGDVRLYTPLTENVTLYPAFNREDVPCLWLTVYLHIEVAKKKWPDKAHLIGKTTGQYFHYDKMEYQSLGEYIPIHYYWHRDTPEVEGGMHLVHCEGCILEEPRTLSIASEAVDGSDLGNIPVEWLTDIDISGELHGWSFMHNLNRLQSRLDRSLTMTDRMLFQFAHPKYMVPKGANVNMQELTGDGLIVSYAGPVAPQLQSPVAATQPFFEYGTSLEAKLEKNAKVFSNTRGTPPPGTRSAAQLMWYAEQQDQRMSLFKMKFTNFIVQSDRKILALCAANYQNHDERLLRVLGEDKAWEVRQFDVRDLASPFCIRPAASSALPESKYARIETVINLNQAIPGFATPQQMASMLDLGTVDKFYDMGRIPIMAAQQEEEAIQRGEELPLAELFEDCLVHLQSHYLFMQRPSYKQADEKQRRNFQDHVESHEMIAWAKGANNPAFVQLLIATLPTYPIFYVLPPEPQAAPAPLPESPIPVAGPPTLPQPMQGAPIEGPMIPQQQQGGI